jgi:hypothetical protein
MENVQKIAFGKSLREEFICKMKAKYEDDIKSYIKGRKY